MKQSSGVSSASPRAVGLTRESFVSREPPLGFLHIGSGNLFGGIEKLLITFGRFRTDYPTVEPHFALCFKGRLSQELSALASPTYFLGEVRTRRPWTVIRARRRLRELLNSIRFNAVVCHTAWIEAIFAPVVRSCGLPIVFYHHGPASGRHWTEIWARLHRPDAAVTNSNFTAGTLWRLYPGLPVSVIYTPVCPPDGWQTGIKDRTAVRSELQTPSEAVVIIQVSRMEAWKGHLLHLQALSQLRSSKPWVCWMVGGPQRSSEVRYYGNLRSVAGKLGLSAQVRFTGERSEVGRFLGAADIFCQPNTGPEPLGGTMVEALYSGLPVVSTALGGAVELVDDSCGVLVPPNNPQALAVALERLLDDAPYRLRLGAAGPARARQMCDPKVQVGIFVDFVSGVVKSLSKGRHQEIS